MQGGGWVILLTSILNASEERWTPVGHVVTSPSIGKESEGLDVLWDFMIQATQNQWDQRGNWDHYVGSRFPSLIWNMLSFSFQWLSLPNSDRDIAFFIFCSPDVPSNPFPTAVDPEGWHLLTVSPRPPHSLACPQETLARDWREEETEVGDFFLPSPGVVSNSSCFSPTRRFFHPRTSSYWVPFGNKQFSPPCLISVCSPFTKLLHLNQLGFHDMLFPEGTDL